LAATLERAGQKVVCIAKPGQEPQGGIRLKSAVFGNFEAHPRVTRVLDIEPAVLFVTVKAPYLKEALGSVPKDLVKNSVVIPLLNGLGHAEVLREKFGKRVAVGMIGAIEVKSEKPGYVEHLTPQIPHIEIASDGDISKSKLEEVAAILKSTGLNAAILDSEAEVIWRKLVRLNAIASVTAVAQRPVGFIRSDPEWRKLLEGCVREGSAVAKAEGVAIDQEEVMRQIDALPEDLTTSLQRDVGKGVPSELEAITGGVLRLAKKHGLVYPKIKSVLDELKKRTA